MNKKYKIVIIVSFFSVIAAVLSGGVFASRMMMNKRTLLA